ncbi:MAG: T9SS type A sorting domain-containing protein [Bacteroidota bacterium]
MGIYRSTNSGDDWTHLTSGLANDGVNAIAIDSSDRLYIADRGFQGYFYQSTNNGDNWARIDSGLTDLVSAVAFDSLDNILIGSFGVYRSTDSGSTWTDIGLGLPSSYVHSIIVMPDGIILAGMGTEGLFFLTDYGSFWSKLDFSFPGGVLTMALNSTGLMFVGTPVAGVYVSADSGGTWTQSNSGLGSLTARSFAFDSAGHAFLATDVGVYKTVQPVTTVISKSDVTPNSFILSQNYPNPFNPSTTIEFTIPYTGAATLKIFNLLGEEVETLVAGVLSSGRHSVVWNAIGKTSGIYFCQLRTGRFIENRKIIFLR